MKTESYCVYSSAKIPCDAGCELYHGFCPYVKSTTDERDG